jgi:long-chain acyl-CoA synthetase
MLLFHVPQEEGRVAQLRGFEQVQAIHLHPDPMTVENGLLTPTFKLKRPQAKVQFQLQIDALYSSLPTDGS